MGDKFTSEFVDLKKSIKEEIEIIKLKDESIKKIEKAEIPIPKKPKKEDFLEFPDDITEIPQEDLGKYIGIYEAECGWITYMLSRREIDLKHGQTLLSFVYGKIYSNLSKDIGSTDKKQLVEADSFYLECKMNILEIESDIDLLKSQLTSIQGYSRAISREITSRMHSSISFPSGRSS